jgi:tetratricopeptide (TPR) repeat protein
MFMSDHVDVITGKERGTGVTVCSDNNVTSAIFVPEKGLLWVAGGDEPACINEYVGYDFKAELAGRPGKPAPAVLPGYVWEDPSRKAAFEEYMRAFDAYEANFSDKKTPLGYLERAIADDPTEPIYPRMAALLSVHLGRYQEALTLLVGSLMLVQSPDEIAMTHLFLGWTYDLAGDRNQALLHYKEVVALADTEEPDPLVDINGLVYLMARRGIEVPFTEKDIKDIPIGFNLETGLE